MTNRRTGLRRSSRHASTSSSQAARLTNLASRAYRWFEADQYTVDGVTSKVGAFTDRNTPSRTFAQATSAAQCAVPSATAAANGALTANFAGAQHYLSSEVSSVWDLLNELPNTVFWIEVPGAISGVQFRATSRTTADGYTLYRNTGPSSSLYVSGVSAQNLTILNPDTNSVPHAYHSTMTAGGLISTFRDYVAGGSASITPGNNPQQTMRIGSDAGSANWLVANWCAFVVFDWVLSGLELSTMRGYFRNKYGTA